MYKSFFVFYLFCFSAVSSTIAAYDPYETYHSISLEGTLVRNDGSIRSYYDQQARNRHCSKPLVKELQRYKESLKSFYQWDTALNFSVALGVGATLANTACDENFRNWYQSDVRSTGTDDWNRIFKTFGEGSFMIPAYFVTSFAYRYLEEYWNLDAGSGKNFGEWASRSSRAVLVGFPPLLLGQLMVGASRPGENTWGSQWKPFNDNNGISGHAFVGAIPFITAAQMTDQFWLKSLFYFGSTLTAWSRINDDAHFLSQAILGWYLAYLSCRAVTRTENPNFGRGLTVFPLVTTDTVGIGVMYRR
ncbi:MAG: phosphatase PAP2 family protein [Planctomycetaceae bacterium]|nr:phosphatase PAP2 family protein [Planctomycetaceae bacterium]